MRKRPVSILIIGWLFIVVGAVSLISGLVPGFGTSVNADNVLEAVVASLVRILAVVGGVFVLRGRNWARWLLVVWLVFHVAISAQHARQELIVHVMLLVVIASFLFRPSVRGFFQNSRSEPS
jgi:hypothetical protein